MKINSINRDYNTPLNSSRLSRKKRLVPAMLIGSFALLLTVLYFKNSTPSAEASTIKSISIATNSVAIELPEIATASTSPSAPINIEEQPYDAPTVIKKLITKNYTVKSGDSLSRIFSQLNYSPTTLHNIMQLGGDVSLLKNITPGQTLRFTQNIDGKCLSIAYDIDRVKTLDIHTNEGGFLALLTERPVEVAHATASSEIQSSLFYDAKEAGLSDKTIMELANIFGWDIDFSQGLRQGDSFSLLYETKHIDGERIENGNILAAEFINRGSKYQAVRFVDKKGHAEYFSPDGKSMRKTFLRNPIDFARVSSRFNLRRKHPVLNRIRAHKGVDYAASTGTPIKSTGDGKIIFRGVKGGYGRVVIVKHGQKYSSLYAHMSKYGRYKNGSRVKQGQVVGYVGKSGLATGPHLHYELRVNGVHRNPLTVKFPAAKPIDKKLLAQFKQQTSPLLSQLKLVKNTQLALNK